MKYPDVYYTLNEMAELAGCDRKGFKDRLIRVCEMYDISIEEFKTFPDEKDSSFLFTPNEAEFVLVLVKNIDKHPLYARNAKTQNITATDVAGFLRGILNDIDKNASDQVKKILYCRNAHHVAQRTSDWAERLSKHLTRFAVNISTLKTEDVGEALRFFTKQLDQMNHALYMNNRFKEKVYEANENAAFGDDIPIEKQKILHELNDYNIGLDTVIAALIKHAITDSKVIRDEGYLPTEKRFQIIQDLNKCIGVRDLTIDDALNKLIACKTTEEEREVYREYFLSADDVDICYQHNKKIADYCKKYDTDWKSLDQQELQSKNIEIPERNELLKHYVEVRQKLVEVEKKQAELHSELRKIEMELHDDEYAKYCGQIDKQYKGLEDVTNHYIGQALNEFLKRDENCKP